MRFVRCDAGGEARWGRVDGSEVRLLTSAPYAGGRESGEVRALAGLRLLAPTEPGKVLCVGINYRDHRDDARGPDTVIADIINANIARDVPAKKDPILFLKAPSAIIGPGDAVLLPPECARVDYEAELALIIGRRLRRARDRAEAAQAIFGYTLANDVSARDVQERDVQWMRAKSFDSFCPVGPWIETELDPADLPLEGILNGEVRQQTSTRYLVADVVELVRFASQAMTLMPGDIFLTGTPTGVGGLKPGDSFTVRARGLGELTNPVRAEAAGA